MIYVNDCSIRVVRSFIKIVQEIFVQILHTKIILQRKKANYGSYITLSYTLFPLFHKVATCISIHKTICW